MISISLSLKRLINNISRYPFQRCTYIYVTPPPPILTSRKICRYTDKRTPIRAVCERTRRAANRQVYTLIVSVSKRKTRNTPIPRIERHQAIKIRTIFHFIFLFILFIFFFFAEKAKQERATPHLSREPSTQQAFLFSFFFFISLFCFRLGFFSTIYKNHTHNITNNTECYSPQQVFCNDYVTVTRSNRIPHNRLRDLHIPTIVYAFAKRPIGMLIRFFFSDVIDLRCI